MKTHFMSRTILSVFQYDVLTEERDLHQYISEEQTPVNCGGQSTHDQLEWVEFYKVSSMFYCHVACLQYAAFCKYHCAPSFEFFAML
jgi:hypothetical protein